MNRMERVFHLRRVELLRDVALETLLRVAEVAEERSVEPGETLFAQGDPADAFWVLLQGEIDIVLGGEVVNRLGPGTAFGETALLDRAPRTAGARARGEGYLLRLSRRAFVDLLERDAHLRWAVVRGAAALVATVESRLAPHPRSAVDPSPAHQATALEIPA